AGGIEAASAPLAPLLNPTIGRASKAISDKLQIPLTEEQKNSPAGRAGARFAEDVGNAVTISSTFMGLKGGAKVASGTGTAVRQTANRAAAGLQEKAISDIEASYREIGGATAKPRNLLAKAEARGKDPARFLAERNVVPEVKDGKVQSA